MSLHEGQFFKLACKYVFCLIVTSLPISAYQNMAFCYKTENFVISGNELVLERTK